MNMYDLDTPALVIDLDVLERNIRSMAAHCAALGIPLRVHTKTHKIPEIARMQVEAGSQGITCQKLGEAEVMAQAGLDDILIPFNIVGEPKVRRLAELLRERTITVSLDSLDTATGLSEGLGRAGRAVRVLIELDTGGKRCGVQSPEAAAELGKQIVGLPGLDLRGIMTYPSFLEAKPFLQHTVALFQEAGLPCEVISGGGTGHEAYSKEIGCTETRSGSYAYEGMTRVQGFEDLAPDRCALRVLTTVVSVPTADRLIIDGGQKTFEAYPPVPYGLVIEQPEARIYAMSVEHGHVDISQCSHRFRVGEKLSVIPRHQGKVTNMHDEVYGVRNGQVVLRWEVKGRGKVK
ncbi:MAG: D-TA family PLP-dependent enzyme [Chloroflexi bacterium]|nr:D-TA family PLP-dependent enzyme [Chloroflexota bacterium]